MPAPEEGSWPAMVRRVRARTVGAEEKGDTEGNPVVSKPYHTLGDFSTHKRQ